MRAIIYTRISSDTTGEGLGVERQEQDCRALVDQRGWTLVDVLTDNDRSAYSGKTRPAYEALLATLERGDADVVVAWHPDRLHRSPTELEAFIVTLEAVGATVETVRGGAVDLSTPAGRVNARVIGAFARYESEHRSDRVRAAHRQIALAGKPGSGLGGHRPFGYEPDQMTIRTNEAAHIRDAVHRVIAGASLHGIVVDWNRTGVRPVAAERWSVTSLKNVLLSARIAGQRSHRGVIVAPAVWPGIITLDEHHRITAVIAARATPRGPGRKYLMTGTPARCGVCDLPLMAAPRRRQRGYGCRIDRGGCGLHMMADPLEAYVVDLLLARAAAGTLAPPRQAPDGRDGALAAILDLERRREQLASDHYVTGDLTDPRQFRAASAALDGRLAKARHRLAAIEEATADAEARASASTLADRWPGLSVEDRRQALARFIGTVRVGPTLVPGRARFDPDRVTVEWVA